jgi:transposase
MTYPSDLIEGQWDMIKEYCDTGHYGNSRKYRPIELVNAVFYLIKTGCQWRFCQGLSSPPYSTVQSIYWRA